MRRNLEPIYSEVGEKQKLQRKKCCSQSWRMCPSAPPPTPGLAHRAVRDRLGGCRGRVWEGASYPSEAGNVALPFLLQSPEEVGGGREAGGPARAAIREMCRGSQEGVRLS